MNIILGTGCYKDVLSGNTLSITDEGEASLYPAVGLKATYDELGVSTTNFHIFRKDNMDFAKCFLGEGVTYKLIKGDSLSTKSIALVESEKGKGLVLGMVAKN